MTNLRARLKGRRFGARMKRALRFLANGATVRAAARRAGLSTWQDVARYARELGIGRRDPTKARPRRDTESRAA